MSSASPVESAPMATSPAVYAADHSGRYSSLPNDHSSGSPAGIPPHPLEATSLFRWNISVSIWDAEDCLPGCRCASAAVLNNSAGRVDQAYYHTSWVWFGANQPLHVWEGCASMSPRMHLKFGRVGRLFA